MTRVYHVMKKEFIQTFRDRRMVGLIFIAPIIQLFIFGYAVTTDIKNIEMGVIDLDKSPESRSLVESFTSSGYFNLTGAIGADDELRDLFHRGKIDMALVIPKDFSEKLSRREQASVQAIYDASDSNFAQNAIGYSQQIIALQSMNGINEMMQNLKALAIQFDRDMPGSLPMVKPAVRIWYNPELKSVYYMVPGVIVMLLMVVTIILTGMAVTREREIGTIEQVIVSPISSWELILGKILPFGILGMVDVFLILIVGTWHFDVPIRGSIALLFFSSALFLFSTLGLGLFFSTISSTQQQSMFVNFMFMLPAILLSGFMFPIENMPRVIQYLTYLNPLRYFLVVIRGIFLKGVGVAELWEQLLAMGIFGVAILVIASLGFSKRMT